MNVLIRNSYYGYHTTDDAVAGGVGQEGFADHRACFARLLQPVRPQGFHAASDIRPAGADDVFEDRFLLHHEIVVKWSDLRAALAFDQGAALHAVAQGGALPIEKSPCQRLMGTVFTTTRRQRFIEARPQQASVDSTLDAGARSSHYAWRTGQKRHSLRRWPKLTLACHNLMHLLIDVIVSNGLSQDALFYNRFFRKLQDRLPVDCVPANAGYGVELNHAVAREQLCIRHTAIALNHRGGRRWARTRYRRQNVSTIPLQSASSTGTDRKWDFAFKTTIDRFTAWANPDDTMP